jgi:hypothetical protein
MLHRHDRAGRPCRQINDPSGDRLLSHSQAGCENSGREAVVRFPIFKKQDAAGVDIDAGGSIGVERIKVRGSLYCRMLDCSLLT